MFSINHSYSIYVWMYKNLNIIGAEKDIYALIYQEYLDNKRFQHSQSDISFWLDISLNTVQACIKKLIQKKYIFCESERGLTNIYTINEEFVPVQYRRNNFGG